jgi:phenylpyruvate tautomerase PptA (4-oxalocrotonate tautomerase family)
MPTITIAMDQTSEEKKKQLIETLTSDASKITGYPPDFFMFIFKNILLRILEQEEEQ